MSRLTTTKENVASSTEETALILGLSCLLSLVGLYASFPSDLLCPYCAVRTGRSGVVALGTPGSVALNQ